MFQIADAQKSAVFASDVMRQSLPDLQLAPFPVFPSFPTFPTFGPALGGPPTSSGFANNGRFAAVARTGAAVPLSQVEADRIVKQACDRIVGKNRAFSLPESTLWNQSIVRTIREQLAGRPFAVVVTSLLMPKGAHMSAFCESQVLPLFSRWENGQIVAVVYIAALA